MIIVENLTFGHRIEICRLDEVTFGTLAESKWDPKSPVECAPTPMLEKNP